MRKWAIVVVVILVVGGGIYWISLPESVAVTLAQVERGTVEKTVANTRAGTIEACQRSRLSLPIGGQIDQLLVSEGDQVKAGQLLVALWNKDRKARVAEAQAAVNSAIKERDSQCISAKSDQREALRLKGLAERNLVSRESADLAVAKGEASLARCDAATARVEQAAASLTVAEAVQEQTELRAPFDGIVAEVTGKIGEYATPSPPGVPTPPAIDLITDDCHYISAPLDEVDAAGIRKGMPVRVTLDAFRDRTFPATVRRIAPYVLDLEKQARTVEVEAEFDELGPDTHMLAGYSADMEIILETHSRVLKLPTELILDNTYVLVLNGDGYLAKREITTGLSNWKSTEILKGLAEGESVIANIGAVGVAAGARAEVVSGDGDAAN